MKGQVTRYGLFPGTVCSRSLRSIIFSVVLAFVVAVPAMGYGGEVTLLHENFNDGFYDDGSPVTWNVVWAHSGNPTGDPQQQDFDVPDVICESGDCYLEGHTTNDGYTKNTAMLYTVNPVMAGSWKFDSRLKSTEDDQANRLILSQGITFPPAWYKLQHKGNDLKPDIEFHRLDPDGVVTTLISGLGLGGKDDTWHTIELTRSAQGEWGLYVDDVLVGTAVDNTYTELPYLMIGRYGNTDNISAISDGNVSIDIKPGSYPNCFNNDGNGVIPVAIFGQSSFDVRDIDIGSVMLESLPVQVAGNSNEYLAHYEDVDSDGYEDLVVQIEDVDGVFSVGDATAALTGELYDSTEIEGIDSICIVP